MNRYKYSEYDGKIDAEHFIRDIYFEATDDYYALDKLDCRYEEGPRIYADVYRVGPNNELLKKIL